MALVPRRDAALPYIVSLEDVCENAHLTSNHPKAVQKSLRNVRIGESQT